METLGQKLRRVRENRGLSQSELARQTGISSSYISLIEGGRRAVGTTLRQHHVSALARVLDVPPEFFEEPSEGDLLQVVEPRARYLTEPIGALLDRLGVQKMADPVGQMEEFGASLGDDDRRTKLPQDIEYTLPKRQRGKKGTQYRAIVAYGQCMNGAIPDGSVVLFEDHGHAEPGALVVAVLDGEQVTVKRLVEDGGERYLVSEQGHRYHVNGDVRLVGPVRLVMQRF